MDFAKVATFFSHGGGDCDPCFILKAAETELEAVELGAIVTAGSLKAANLTPEWVRWRRREGCN